ncbi:MAG: hypothetical protein IH623_07655 [Verrucomicrobia bacterium]|nr:hypothetical protein [Verrucomicrobiota bacterium]
MNTLDRQKLDVVHKTRATSSVGAASSRRIRAAGKRAKRLSWNKRPEGQGCGRYRDILRSEIADTVAAPEEVEEEIRHLFATFGP